MHNITKLWNYTQIVPERKLEGIAKKLSQSHENCWSYRQFISGYLKSVHNKTYPILMALWQVTTEIWPSEMSKVCQAENEKWSSGH